jgi:hypothetical protein
MRLLRVGRGATPEPRRARPCHFLILSRGQTGSKKRVGAVREPPLRLLRGPAPTSSLGHQMPHTGGWAEFEGRAGEGSVR